MLSTFCGAERRRHASELRDNVISASHALHPVQEIQKAELEEDVSLYKATQLQIIMQKEAEKNDALAELRVKLAEERGKENEEKKKQSTNGI